MNITGNIFLGISTFLFFVIIYFLFNKESSRGGVAMAYVWVMISLHFVLFVCMAIVAGIIGSKGGFIWVGAPRFLLIGGGLLLAVSGSCLWAFFKIDSDTEMTLLRLSGHIFPTLILLLLLWGGVILLNDQWRSTVGAASFQWPLQWAAILGALGVVVFAISLFVQERRNAQAKE